MTDTDPIPSARRLDPATDGPHQHGKASGHARVYQAGRDQYIAEHDLHVHHTDGVHAVRRIDPNETEQPCPYPGLAAFTTQEAQWFFGRDQVTAALIERVAERLTGDVPVMVVAPSGAGKSSILRAGLLPAITRGALPMQGSAQWPSLVMTPTAQPLTALVHCLATLAGLSDHDLPVGNADQIVERLRDSLSHRCRSPTTWRVVLIVDQLEELFTLCRDPAQRQGFIDLLASLAAATDQNRPPMAIAVCGLRSDFYTPATDYHLLREALQDGQLVVGPMSATQLREAVLFPAQAAGLGIEPGLVEILLRDLAPTGVIPPADLSRIEEPPTSYEAGRLPLLAHALRTTWQQRHGNTLTVAGYHATGGIHQAVAATAERIYDRLDPVQQQAAQTVFLRLVNVGDGETAADTRRRVSRTDLVSGIDDPTAVGTALGAFTHGRLVTHAQDTIEITHEALLHAWPRLRDWLAVDRAGHRLWQEIEDAALAWDHDRTDTSILWRGARLVSAETWTAARVDTLLSPIGSAFLTTSARHRCRSNRVRRTATTALVILTLAAVTLTGFAYRQQRTARAATQVAEQQRNLAAFGQITLQANALRATDSALAAQLDVVAYRIKPTIDVRGSLIADTYLFATADRVDGDVTGAMALSPNGHILAETNQDDTIRLWAVTGPGSVPSLSSQLLVSGHPLRSLAFTSDGRTLASGSDDGTVQLWNITNPHKPSPLGQPLTGDNVNSLAFSPNGHTLASNGNDGTVQLWNITNPHRPIRLSLRYIDNAVTNLRMDSFNAHSVAFSPDGHALVAGSNDIHGHGVIQLWNVTDPAHPQALSQHSTGGGRPMSLAFSPDGHTLASADVDIQLWNITDPGQVNAIDSPLINYNGSYSITFIDDGHVLASASNLSDGQTQLWNVTNPAQPAPLDTPLTSISTVESLASSSDGTTFATINDNNQIVLWFTNADLDIYAICRAVGRGASPLTLQEWRRYIPELPFNPPCQ